MGCKMAAGGLVQHVPSCVTARQPSAPSCVAPSQGHVNIKNPQPSVQAAMFFSCRLSTAARMNLSFLRVPVFRLHVSHAGDAVLLVAHVWRPPLVTDTAFAYQANNLSFHQIL